MCALRRAMKSGCCVDLGHVQAYAKLAALIVQRMDVLAFADRFYQNLKFTDKDMAALLEPMGKWLLRGPLEGKGKEEKWGRGKRGKGGKGREEEENKIAKKDKEIMQ